MVQCVRVQGVTKVQHGDWRAPVVQHEDGEGDSDSARGGGRVIVAQYVTARSHVQICLLVPRLLF